ncbi:MAG TPA: helix-turn-helix transcriptional regulator [Candidatus Anammoximicrobium sp.]|nr:helix-turn-helix transcriptional regulator [Candidatus Anammoximicrobium sp.]
MSYKIRETVRDRYLTEEEAAKYRKIRELVAEELPELRVRAKARLQELRDATEVFAELRKVREAQGLSLGDVQRLTGIDRSALSKLERGERVNFTVDTLTRYAAAMGKHVLFQLADATEA